MLLYNDFYNKYGIRVASQLMSPPLPKIDKLDLPKQAILHYVTNTSLEVGPASDDFLFRNIQRPIMVGHISELTDTEGNPRRMAVSVDSMVRAFHNKNRRFKLMRDRKSAERDINSLIVFNYGLIPSIYRYTRSYYTDYYKCANIQATLWKNIAEITKSSDRNHFVICRLPTILPSIPNLRLAIDSINQKTVKIFNSPESLVLLDLWKWFGEERKLSHIASVGNEHLDKVNLVFQESGCWFVMNLGRMNRWRIATKEELEEWRLSDKKDPLGNPEPNTKGIVAKQLQIRFLRLMMTLFQTRTVGDIEDSLLAADNTSEQEEELDVSATLTKQDVGLPVIDKTTNLVTSVNADTIAISTMPANGKSSDETIKHDEELEKQIEKDLSDLETISNTHIGELNSDGDKVEQTVVINENPTLEDGVMNVCDRLADAGLLSAAEYKYYGDISKSYRKILAPGGKETLDTFIDVKPETLVISESAEIKDIKTVTDKTMLKSSLLDFDRRYIKEVMPRDVASMVLSVQNAGIAVTGFETERVENVMGSFEAYTIKVKPVDGAPSTLRFELPTIDDDGVYTANGTRYKVRKQRGDLPIRKVAPDSVALTSYYGKTFVTRNSKATNDHGQWLRNNIMVKGLDTADTTITNLHPTNVFNNFSVTPKIYSSIAMGFKDFTVTSCIGNKEVFNLFFDYNKREEAFGKDNLVKYEKDGALVIGEQLKNPDRFLVMGKDSELYIGEGGKLTDYGTIEELLGLDESKSPVEFAELRVMGKAIPIGIIFGYEIGLTRLLKTLGVNPRRVHAGTRVNLESHEYSIVFADETWVFAKDDRKASLILSGFNEYRKAIKEYDAHEFDKRGVYLNILESAGLTTRYLRELDLMYQMFIDPITRGLLIEMKEPTTFGGLLTRSCELLMTDQHPDELDPAFMRIKGYERMAGAVYSELVRSIRSHSGRPGKSKQPIDLNPYAVWMSIRQDPAVALVSDINPINNLKEMEAVTFGGTGGRGSRSMTKRTRIYHRNDMGTMSESTVDSSDVAINTFTSADPQFTSLRGISKRYVIGKTGATALFSSTALISPCTDTDDPKRVNFASIQASHVIPCAGYKQGAVRTGYEQVIAHRTGDLFAATAKKSGKVTSVTETGIIVQYDDGEVKGYEIGRRFGHAAGLVVPHDVVSNVKEGQKLNDGDLISYNTGFFEKDYLNPNNAVWKSGLTVKTALMESTKTLEDSSAISSKIANLLKTNTTKVKDVVVNFDQSIHKLLKEGVSVEADDILCIIEDAVTANAELFDSESLDTLKILGAQTPQAKAHGIVERVEVFYHGDKEDMSESLKAIVSASDIRIGKRNKAIGKRAFTGAVNNDFRVDGEPLALDTANIRFYITGEVAAGIGDKAVFCNQMKTVICEVYDRKVVSESGVEVDAIFGYESISARIVTSPILIGTTTTLLDIVARNAVAVYKGK